VYAVDQRGHGDSDPADVYNPAVSFDDISGIGQTKAAHALTPNIPGARHVHWEQPRVGHYGIFNGRKWREQIMPRVRDFIRDNDAR